MLAIEAYWRLTKPRIWSLLLFTGIAAMLVAYRENRVEPSLLKVTISALAITAGSAAANTLTNYHDRDIDSIMLRTRNRPLPRGIIKPRDALIFGLSLAFISMILSIMLSPLSALFMLVGLLDNIVIYSILLKRRSWTNIILGGVSGGMPVLVGYSSVSNTISPIAVYMALLVIVWIPTHIWSLAISYKEDYKAAKVPMLPVVFGERIAAVCIAGASALLTIFTFAIYLFTAVSPFYIVSSASLGAIVLAYSAKLAMDKREDTAWKLFKITSPYLALIFLVFVVDIWFF